MKIDLYLDLDGVFTNFRKGVKDILKIDVPEGRLPEDEWKKFSDFVAYKIWCRPFFWIDLEIFPGSLDMYKYFEHYKPNILTAVPHAYTLDSFEAVTAAEEKKQWVRQNMSHDQALRFHYTKADMKHTFCKPEEGKLCVLIDDMESNIRNWESVGGIGIRHTDVEKTKQEFCDRVLEPVLRGTVGA